MLNECYDECGDNPHIEQRTIITISSQHKILLTHITIILLQLLLMLGMMMEKRKVKYTTSLYFYLGHKDEDLCCFLHLKG